jgi:hypothetical protein
LLGNPAGSSPTRLVCPSEPVKQLICLARDRRGWLEKTRTLLRQRLNAERVVIPGIVHPQIHRVEGYLLRQVRMQERLEACDVLHVRIEPQFIVIRGQDH